jgi:hypothetical protein
MVVSLVWALLMFYVLSFCLKKKVPNLPAGRQGKANFCLPKAFGTPRDKKGYTPRVGLFLPTGRQAIKGKPFSGGAVSERYTATKLREFFFILSDGLGNLCYAATGMGAWLGTDAGVLPGVGWTVVDGSPGPGSPGLAVSSSSGRIS